MYKFSIHIKFSKLPGRRIPFQVRFVSDGGEVGMTADPMEANQSGFQLGFIQTRV